METMGERVKRLREERGLTAAVLGSRAGIGENALYKIESGVTKQPSFGVGVKLAKALQVSPWMIAFGRDEAEPDALIGKYEIGKQIEAARSRLGLSVEEAADRCGVAVWRWIFAEDGEHVRPPFLEALEKGLGATIDASPRRVASVDLPSSLESERQPVVHLQELEEREARTAEKLQALQEQHSALVAALLRFAADPQNVQTLLGSLRGQQGAT